MRFKTCYKIFLNDNGMAPNLEFDINASCKRILGMPNTTKFVKLSANVINLEYFKN